MSRSTGGDQKEPGQIMSHQVEKGNQHQIDSVCLLCHQQTGPSDDVMDTVSSAELVLTCQKFFGNNKRVDDSEKYSNTILIELIQRVFVLFHMNTSLVLANVC